MSVNIFHSRRKNYAKCLYWHSIKKPYNELIYEVQPSGLFYACDISPKQERNNEIFNRFQFSSSTILLETDDNIGDLCVNDIVRYFNEYWIVSDIQKELHRKETYYSKKPIYKYIINIRKD